MLVTKFLSVAAAIIVVILTMGSDAVLFDNLFCGALNTFTTPSEDNPTGKTVSDSVDVTCQVEGLTMSFGVYNIWDMLSDGSFINDAFVDTGTCGFSPKVPLCSNGGGVSTNLK